MPELAFDQATGLRRMTAASRARAIALVSGSRAVGTTSAVINIAAALAACGQRVLVIDEHGGPGSVQSTLGIQPRFELLHVLHAACPFDDALSKAPGGLSVLAATVPATAPARGSAGGRLSALLGAIDECFDIVLIDARPVASPPGIFARAALHTIIVSSPAAHAITGAYALIKRLRGEPGLQVLLTCITSNANARVIFGNLQQVAASRLQTALASAGAVAWDENVVRASRACMPVTRAYPASPAAADFRRIAASIAQWPERRAPRPAPEDFPQRGRASPVPPLFAGGRL